MEKKRSVIIKEIKRLISGIVECSTDSIDLKTNFYRDLGVDSIKVVEILVALERNFSISVRDSQIFNISTVGEIVDLIAKDIEETGQ